MRPDVRQVLRFFRERAIWCSWRGITSALGARAIPLGFEDNSEDYPNGYGLCVLAWSRDHRASERAFPLCPLPIATDLRTCWEVGVPRAIERFESRLS